MKIQLIEGEFNPSDALELITQMIHVKIRYHENKISKSMAEEDLKRRENKIIKLQKELYEMKNKIGNINLKLNASINID